MSDSPQTLDYRLHTAFEWVLERLPGRPGERIREATGGRFGIGTQIVLGLGGGVLLTVVSIILALILMSIVSGRQSEVTEEHMPSLVSASEVAQRSAEILRATPGLLAATDEEDLDRVRQEVVVTENFLSDAVAFVAGTEDGVMPEGGVGEGVVPLVDSLLEIVEQIHQSVLSRMNRQQRLLELDVLLADVSLRLQADLEGELDDQHFFMRTGLRDLTDSPVPGSRRRSIEELEHYSGLLLFKAYQNEVTAQVAQAMTESDIELLNATLERFETALNDVTEALTDIRARPRARLEGMVEELSDLAVGADGVFATRNGELVELATAEALVTRSNRIAEDLVARVETLKEQAQFSAQRAASRSSDLVQLGVWFLVTVTVVTIFLGFVAWKFFGERMLVRIGRLSSATRQMSKGDLDVQVEIEGNDELTDMAGALEVFRQHAVEVQRLNLVEKLAAEVQAKNSELEDTLENLRRTQQQVVKQEKLASLGALTAGIAHEIRNPLNFVNNFAALSSELIEELKEELAESGNGDGDGELDREYIEEILNDLNTNVVKVNEHGQRANSIVDGMLAHSRDDAGQIESVNVNAMVQEYARLAYHGMRGTDSSFNCDMIYQIDKDAGMIEGIGRDLSRVFLNVITNACHATQARGRKEHDTYMPTVTISTEGRKGDVLITVRDNGTGIPDEIVSRIFDPFFTTKSGTQGTGLGLSISHEIVQEHGGRIEVETEPGEFTEFRITLPRKSYDPVSAAS